MSTASEKQGYGSTDLLNITRKKHLTHALGKLHRDRLHRKLGKLLYSLQRLKLLDWSWLCSLKLGLQLKGLLGRKLWGQLAGKLLSKELLGRDLLNRNLLHLLHLLGGHLLGRNLLGRNLLCRHLLCRNLLCRNLLGRDLLGRNLLGGLQLLSRTLL